MICYRACGEILQIWRMQKDTSVDEVSAGEFQKQDVEVIRTHYNDGWLNRENLKVNSDGTRYYEPNDGQWHRVKDLK